MTIAPDYVEPVRAWRTWLVVSANGSLALRSVLFPMVWHPAQPTLAECLRAPALLARLRRRTRLHSAPAVRCACGIYGASLETATAYLRAPAACAGDVVATAIGIVSLWGSVVESDGGWRGSRAYPAHLFVRVGRAARETVLDALAAYRVPVVALESGRAPEVSETLASFDPLP